MTSMERKVQTLMSVTDIINNNISGDLIEIGVWKGGVVMIMLYKLLQLGVNDRIIHLYDTFSGMTESSNKDIDPFGRIADYTSPGIKCECSYDEVYENIKSVGYPMENIIFHIGDIRKTDILKIPTHISLLRLDNDWYELYKFELPIFEPNVSIGGIITIDDYGFWNGCKEAVDNYIKDKNVNIQFIDDCGVYWYKTI
jgi:hypothetical protein